MPKQSISAPRVPLIMVPIILNKILLCDFLINYFAKIKLRITQNVFFVVSLISRSLNYVYCVHVSMFKALTQSYIIIKYTDMSFSYY